MTAISIPQRFSEVLLEKAANIRLVFFDIDGVWTDGRLYLDENGESLKCFNTLDGYGIKLLQRANIESAVITGRDSVALRQRLKALGITHALFGVQDKKVAAQSLIKTTNIQWEQCAAMGDDWPDLPLFERCAFSCAPKNAHAEVLARANYVTNYCGGEGAVREFCDLLLMACGDYGKILQEELRK